MAVRILTDSTCDLPGETVQRLGICVLPVYIHTGNHDYLDGIDITREEFYQKLPGFAEHPTTAVPSPGKFRSLYDSLADEGASEVLSIHISSSLSGLLGVAQIAASETTSTAVTVFDSRQLSLGTGFLVQTAAEMAQQGCPVSEILPALEDQIKRSYVAAGLDTLKYLRRSGRMNGAISTIGELMQIKPILKMHDGVSGVERVRTHQKLIARLVEKLKSFAPLDKLAFLHSGALESVMALKNEVREMLPSREVYIGMINPVLGAHLGPGVVGFACVQARTGG